MWKFNMSRRYRISDELYHYNKNHDPTNGQFAKSNNGAAKSEYKITKPESRVNFGNNKECRIIVQDDNYDAVNRVLNDKELDKKLRKIACDSLYPYRLNKSKNETKEQYLKNLKCIQITAHRMDTDFDDDYSNDYDSDVAIWYGNPNDFGEYYFDYNSKSKKVIASQGY